MCKSVCVRVHALCDSNVSYMSSHCHCSMSARAHRYETLGRSTLLSMSSLPLLLLTHRLVAYRSSVCMSCGGGGWGVGGEWRLFCFCFVVVVLFFWGGDRGRVL